MEFGVYVLDLWAAGQSCRDAVGDYRDWAATLPGKLKGDGE